VGRVWMLSAMEITIEIIAEALRETLQGRTSGSASPCIACNHPDGPLSIPVGPAARRNPFGCGTAARA
jgi:hypothetical protein